MTRTLEESSAGDEHAGAAASPPVYSGRGPVTGFVDRIANVVESFTMWAAACSVLLMMFISAVSVAGRELFGSPIPDDVIFQGLLMVATIALPLAYIHRRDGHISVTITTNWMPPRAIALLRILGAIMGFIFFAIIGTAVLRDIVPDYVNDAVIDGVFELPKWPMKVVFVFGIAAFLLRIILSIVISVIDLWRGEAPGLET